MWTHLDSKGRKYLEAFIAGLVSTLVFHQGALEILHAAGLAASAPYAVTSTWPFHVPAVVSLAVWGGVWAIVLSHAIDHSELRRTYWASWLVLGAGLPTLVALYVVLPLKGVPAASVWSPAFIGDALLLNAAWGSGVALLVRGVESLSLRPAPHRLRER